MPFRPTSLLPRLFCAAALLTGAAAFHPAPAAADALTLTHLAPDQFPETKAKSFNSNFTLDGAAGNAVIRSRYSNADGADGEKIYVFSYQLDLKAAYEISGPAGINAVTLDLPKAPDFATWPKLPDGARLYVVNETGDDPGVDLSGATLEGGKLTFTFATPVRAGKTPGTGTHSLWFGLVSTTKPGRGKALMTTLAAASPPPASPSTAAGGKPADNQTGNTPAALDQADINVFVPLGDQTGN